MTPMQRTILKFINEHHAQYFVSPTIDAIATELRVPCTSVVYECCFELVRTNFLHDRGPAEAPRRFVPTHICRTCGGPFKR